MLSVVPGWWRAGRLMSVVPGWWSAGRLISVVPGWWRAGMRAEGHRRVFRPGRPGWGPASILGAIGPRRRIVRVVGSTLMCHGH